MGKGDKKSRRGKIHIGSSGVRRHRKKAPRKAALPVITAEEPIKKPKARPAGKPKPVAAEAPELPEIKAPEIVEAEAPEVKDTKRAPKKKAPAKTTAKKTKKEDKPSEPAE